MTGLCWSMQTTFFMSSKLGSLGTQSWKGGRYSSAIPTLNLNQQSMCTGIAQEKSITKIINLTA